MVHLAIQRNNEPNEHYSGREHRKHARIACACPVKICELTAGAGSSASQKKFHPARSKDLSESGIKIATCESISRNASALIDVDFDKLSSLVPIHTFISFKGKRLLGKVAWRKLNLKTGLFEVGIKFVEENERSRYEPVINYAKEVP